MLIGVGSIDLADTSIFLTIRATSAHCNFARKPQMTIALLGQRLSFAVAYQFAYIISFPNVVIIISSSIKLNSDGDYD